MHFHSYLQASCRRQLLQKPVREKKPHSFKLPLLLPFPWKKRKENREVRHRPQEYCGKAAAESHSRKPNNQINGHIQACGSPEDLLKCLHRLNSSKPQKGLVPPLEVPHTPHLLQTQMLGARLQSSMRHHPDPQQKRNNKNKTISKCVWSSRCWWSHTTRGNQSLGLESSARVMELVRLILMKGTCCSNLFSQLFLQKDWAGFSWNHHSSPNFPQQVH